MNALEIATRDALQMFEEYEVDEDPCREALRAVLDAKPPARPLLLEVAEARLEFYEVIATEPRRRTCYAMALACIHNALNLMPDDSGHAGPSK